MRIAYFSELSGEENFYASLRTELLRFARNPNPGYEFDEKTREARNLPDREFLDFLINLRHYDAVMFYVGETPLGYLGFQRKGDKRVDACFIYAVQKSTDSAMNFMLEFIEDCRKREIRKIFTTRGKTRENTKIENHAAVVRVLHRLKENSEEQRRRIEVNPYKGLIKLLY
ncbi:hypothetical protein FJZ19_00525 [Candidatus Pacearchaeota archaeon]|nr:hypothetical protein [Candidatus Pacearchaeota archaeon]